MDGMMLLITSSERVAGNSTWTIHEECIFHSSYFCHILHALVLNSPSRWADAPGQLLPRPLLRGKECHVGELEKAHLPTLGWVGLPQVPLHYSLSPVENGCPGFLQVLSWEEALKRTMGFLSLSLRRDKGETHAS